ncbi:MAG: secondary thiamine-phosphate synthase enzyme YjbQ [Candidatus Zixiibacteriota bacterium]
MIYSFTVKTSRREEMIDVTNLLMQALRQAGADDGIAVCFVPHTTAGITINENADPDVRRDILHKLGKEIPREDGYHHGEGNSDAHIKASLLGSSVQVLIEKGRPVLGQWQGVFFCEFDGPRTRQLIIKVAGFA